MKGEVQTTQDEAEEILKLESAAPGYGWTVKTSQGERIYIGDGWLEASFDDNGWPIFSAGHPRYGRFTYHMCPFGHLTVGDSIGRAEIFRIPYARNMSEIVGYFRSVEMLSYDTFWTDDRIAVQSRLLDEINRLRASWGLGKAYANCI